MAYEMWGSPMTLEEIIETDVVTAERDTTIEEIVDRMANRSVGSVVIVEENKPVGVVTDRKIALALRETPDITNKQAADIMTGEDDLITVTGDTGIFEVIRTLGDAGIRRVPVVDDQENLEGIISLDDILVMLIAEFDNVSDVIEKQSQRF